MLRLLPGQVATLASTSRFISQAPFVLYKGLLCTFYLFWCVRWPLADYTDIFLFVTYWTWYIGALCECTASYTMLAVSAASASAGVVVVVVVLVVVVWLS